MLIMTDKNRLFKCISIFNFYYKKKWFTNIFSAKINKLLNNHNYKP